MNENRNNKKQNDNCKNEEAVTTGDIFDLHDDDDDDSPAHVADHVLVQQRCCQCCCCGCCNSEEHRVNIILI